ncbi:hypothetical protein RchiOBHm_Chr2g0137691 [Rosa chinensis]|uniref:Uncharacterized protein n=1 Tax=Rosa chinensis TaxID=74649 RepID=A0A2P6RWM8_ROSCH|nr:hypothetical protein RchiOBHm_Chr2g0137691 [Rosa chinensis]
MLLSLSLSLSLYLQFHGGTNALLVSSKGRVAETLEIDLRLAIQISSKGRVPAKAVLRI